VRPRGGFHRLRITHRSFHDFAHGGLVGDTGVDGILGAKVPDLSNHHWRWFYTQQHGDNPTYEVILKDNRD